MYIIKCDNNILMDYRYEELSVSNPILNLEVNKFGSASFVMYPSHPYYDKIRILKSIITIYQNNKIIFKGRPTDYELGFYNEKKVVIEGILSYLLDSIQEPFEYKGNLKDFFIQLINNHNSQVEEFQKFKIGKITVRDSNDYINRSSINYLTTKEVIETRLLQLNGGYLNVRYEEDGNYIDYLSDFEKVSEQVIEFGENLINLTQKEDATNIVTGIIPLGAKIKDNDGKETNERVTIESVNNGCKYILDNEMVKQYGKIFKVVEFENITVPNNLLTKAKQTLSEGVKLSNILELTSIDLNNVDKSIESFNFCDYVKVISIPHNISKMYLLQKLNIDMANPQNTKITLGESFKTLTDITVGFSRDNNNLIEKASNNVLNIISQDFTAKEEFKTIEELVKKQLNQIFSFFNFNETLKGVALGKESTKNGFEINMDIYDKYDTKIRNGLAIFDKNNSIDPNTSKEELILTNHFNTPLGKEDEFFFIRTMFNIDKDLTSNRRQIAYPYAKENGIYTRYYSNGWSEWELVSSNINLITNGPSVKTGRIIDGKLEYVKRIDFGSLPNATTKRVATGLTLTNITVTDVKAMPRTTSGDVNVIPFVHAGALTSQISIYLRTSDNTIVVDCGAYDRSAFTMKVDIYYINN